jgi:ornithine racemase
MPTPTPRVEIRVDKLVDNALALSSLCGSRGIQFTAVMKGVCGSPRIAAALHAWGIRSFGDSRISNLRLMKKAGLRAEFLLIRSPSPSEVDSTVEWADISLNTELSVLKLLARAARRRGVLHRVIVMVELGDLREGAMPSEIDDIVSETIHLQGIELAGIGANLACLNGVSPSTEKMEELSEIANRVERRHGVTLGFVSGGNSASYQWLLAARDPGRVNHLRIGESMLLGCNTLTRRPIPGLHTDAFTLVAEVMEVKTKPSLPYGEIGQDAFGHRPRLDDRGDRRRAILAIGRQDVDPAALRPTRAVEIVGASSDHLVLDATETDLHVGDEVRFGMGYSALLRAMTSRYVAKTFAQESDPCDDPGGPMPASRVRHTAVNG